MDLRVIQKPKRNRTPVLGEIDPNKLYTRQRILEVAGIGEPQLVEAREAGVLEALDTGSFFWYRGSDLIAWIEYRTKRGRA